MASLELSRKRYEQQTVNEASGDVSTDERKLVRRVRALLAHQAVQGGLGSDGPLTDTARKPHMVCEAMQPTALGRLAAPMHHRHGNATPAGRRPPRPRTGD